MLMQQFFLLYEELTWAMNAGDIGRVEECFMPWIFIFKGCGKHKYATQMLQFLHNLHLVYPAGLRCAIRMNILCNPMGKKHCFRAIDWWVEHNNLYTKRIYGGRFSNHTKKRILKESVLIEVFKIVRINFEDMFALDHRTYRHSPPKMQQTFNKLGNYVRQKKTHIRIPGQKAKYIVPDVMEAGMCKLISTEKKEHTNEDGVDVEEEADGENGDLDA
ncbi:hypothetical protein BKA93DRAFT_747706 [Sparassis latifolia]